MSQLQSKPASLPPVHPRPPLPHHTSTTSTGPADKQIKKLKKKLIAIEDLKKRKDNGDPLEENQVSLYSFLACIHKFWTYFSFPKLTKIASEQDVLDEIAMLEEVLASSWSHDCCMILTVWSHDCCMILTVWSHDCCIILTVWSCDHGSSTSIQFIH